MQKSRIDATVLEMPIPLPVVPMVVRKRDEKAELKVEEKNEKIEQLNEIAAELIEMDYFT